MIEKIKFHIGYLLISIGCRMLNFNVICHKKDTDNGPELRVAVIFCCEEHLFEAVDDIHKRRNLFNLDMK